MDPCPFVRLIVESLALKLPPVTPKHAGAAGSGVHPSSPSTTPYFSSLKLQFHQQSTSLSTSVQQTTPLPLFPEPPASSPTSSSSSSSSSSQAVSSPVVFHLDPSVLHRATKPASLTIAIYSGRSAGGPAAIACGLGTARRVLGRARVVVDLRGDELLRTPVVYFSGWVAIGGSNSKGESAAASSSAPRVHVVVRSEPDPRYVFQFGGEPECSPVVYQINRGGAGHRARGQPVFSCRFTSERRTSTGSSFLTDDNGASTPLLSRPQWLRTLSGGGGGGGGDHHSRRSILLPRRPPQQPRKGWTVTIHDLSGSPVAAASMITPFCPSPSSGSPDRVSRTSPGAWLVLQPVASFGGSGSSSWKPWGRLEAWRERGAVAAAAGGGDALGYRFELVGAEPGDPGVLLTESQIGMRRGGEFRIDLGGGVGGVAASAASAVAGGFVMVARIEGEGKLSRPRLEVAMHHVRCAADAALFVALAAAVDLSMDACGLFSRKLKKELCHDRHER